MLSSQEIAVLPVKEPCARTQSEASSGSETEPEEDTFSRPEPKHVIKLSAHQCGSGGRFQWRGRLRGGGGDVYLECAWVRKNFKAYVAWNRTRARIVPSLTAPAPRALRRGFLDKVQAAGGRFRHIPTGNARPQAAPVGLGGHWDGPEVLSAPGTSREVIPTAECPVVAHRQGAADLCAARV